MDIFSLNSEDNNKKEEEKEANIMKLKDAIKKDNLTVKH